ncbi:MAG: ADP-forming succinate--CoA ligase subunit beta [Armatimonadota bacterium]|nr:ADP-forming succinate--CoA ligase subunit beta [Armatimonadota bacterium]MDR7437436.1 ADP-forming succinate--CoA ligase subunit beta [Armatimonadota bacterium]MDR7473187.1 ADP-forming succinate--CoA ligase subunit beta [Armatimonadota bacterium]MDR7506945.1 ADP-forming succinate--CoA ligase subunit beta [Armatimonadota bacterium]MDR7509366.1 ADP-forming succinate--CoA ligase subunit beta [Armatimonadota bacterium]
MKLHEFQAKELFARYGIPVQRGAVVERPDQIDALDLRYPVVLKAQVLVGGRGKAGGIRLASTPREAAAVAAALLGMEIRGERVRRLLVAEAAEIAAEYYLAFTVDRSARRLVAVASAAGGVDIEEVARATPEAIARLPVDPWVGFLPYHARRLGRAIGLSGPLLGEFAGVATALYRLVAEQDAELAEINPLGVVGGHLLAVDAKVVVDDNALFRHPELPASEELTDLERLARAAGLSYVELDGDIAIVGNGAGLVMATLDMVAHFGGRPANFLDVGGGATTENMRQAIEIALRKPGVRVLFINIFGGITRCDDIARGIVSALPPVPLVVRLTGTNEEQGQQILQQAGIHAFVDPDDAARQAVALASRR